MKKYFAAAAFAAVLTQPASAITFPGLTTIYVGSGVVDDGGGTWMGFATAFNCSNVSTVAAQMRWLVLGVNGVVEGSFNATLFPGSTRTVGTHLTASLDVHFNLHTGVLKQGVVNIESTQSGVFCNAVVLNAEDGAGYALPLVRVNPHPGTVE